MTDQPLPDSSIETREHIARVAFYLGAASANLMKRAALHDASKLEEPEKSAFDRLAALKLSGMAYGSEEYRASLRKEKPAIEHHYAKNSHHPEYWRKRRTEHGDRCSAAAPALKNIANDVNLDLPAGLRAAVFFAAETLERDAKELEASVGNMSLFDVLEMLVDWKAASERMADGGDIAFSIKHNIERFHLSPQLASILVNTAIEFGWIDRKHAITAGVLSE